MIFPPPAHSGGGLQITNSVRLRAAASAYLSRTFASPTTQDTFTFSAWVKRSKLSSLQNLLGVSTNTSIGFPAADTLVVTCAGSATITTSGLYRDPSAWCHVQYKQTTGAATLYFNGASVGTSATVSAVFNTAVAHQLGAANTSNYTDGYLSDIYFIDGQALTPSSFGQQDSNGVWVPKAYTGTYGTNGFHLDFSDATSLTTLGYDAAGSNDWTLNNVSLTAGVTYDSMVDTPTNNYPGWNSLGNLAGMVLADGNLKITNANGDYRGCLASVAFPSSGKFYWEAQATSNPGPASLVNLGMATASVPLTWDQYGYTNSVGWYLYGAALTYWIAGGTTIGASTTSNVFQIAYDASTGKVWMGRDNTWYWGNTSTNNTTGDPAGGTNPSFTMSAAEFYAWMFAYSNGATANFGQCPFTYTPPTGFKALCTANSTGTITVSGTFTGNAAADGPFVWIGGTPTVLTINGNAVTFGTHADKTAGGFKLRTSSASYNTAGANTWTATAAINFGTASLAPAPAQGNP